MQKLSQNLSQQQKLFPKVILNQSVLAIPTLALETMIKQELEDNVLLEEGETDDIEEIEEQEGDELDAVSELNEKTSGEITAENSGDAPEHSAEPLEDVKVDKNEEFDWDDYFDKEQYDYDSSPGSSGTSGESYEFDNSTIRSSSFLTDSLLLQLHLLGSTEKQRYIGEEILGSLNSEGYLTCNTEDILTDINDRKTETQFAEDEFTVLEINTVLKNLQNHLEPAGIGARNLQECLALQLDRMPLDPAIQRLCNTVINKYFEELRLKSYEKISKELKINMDKVNKIFEIIQKLNPKPGLAESGEIESYIYPDIIVTQIEDEFEIYLNEKSVPSIRINRAYRNMYMEKGSGIDKSTKDFLTSNFNRAKWFIDAINSRRDTLCKVMRSILNRQYVFFSNKGHGLSPMIEKEVADDIKMDVSTVSRATKGKYVQTDFGIYPLRYFFSNSISIEDGSDVSSRSVKDKLKEIIENENHEFPFTDEELTEEMNKAGFKIARRTVTKYREGMNIAKARLRRKLL
ncbi:RNA polymerase factor sigma-54 [soil metagenome]